MHCRALLLATVALAATSFSATAQSLSDDEILQRFMVQRDAYTAARTGTGSTRGLSIVTVDDLNQAPSVGGEIASVDAGGPEQASPGGEDSTVIVAGGDDAAPVGDTAGSETSGGLVEVASNDKPPTIDPNQVGLLPEELQVNVRISFNYDSAVLDASQQPVLDQMCRVMKGSDIKLFRIMGHTDSAGSDEYNENLSALRAEEVKRRLVADCGIDPSRLEAMGLGERFPFDKRDPKGAENRRVEFQAMS